MKLLNKIVLAVVTVGSCAIAGAQTSSADQERRERNREEAIAAHDRMGSQGDTRSSSMRERSRDASGSMREKTHEGASTARSKGHQAAQSTKSFTHRQLNKVRSFGERQGNKLPKRQMQAETNKTPAALGK